MDNTTTQGAPSSRVSELLRTKNWGSRSMTPPPPQNTTVPSIGTAKKKVSPLTHPFIGWGGGGVGADAGGYVRHAVCEGRWPDNICCVDFHLRVVNHDSSNVRPAHQHHSWDPDPKTLNPKFCASYLHVRRPAVAIRGRTQLKGPPATDLPRGSSKELPDMEL